MATTMRSGAINALSISLILFFLTSCGGSGGGGADSVLPASYTLQHFSLPSQLAQVIGVSRSGVVTLFVRSSGFYRWSKGTGIQVLLSTTETLNGITVDDDGRIGVTRQDQSIATVDETGIHPVVSSGQPLKGTIIGFRNGSPVLRNQNGQVVFPGSLPLALGTPPSEPTTEPHCTNVGVSGQLGGSLGRTMALPGGIFVYPWAAVWSSSGALTEMNHPLADQYQSRILAVLDDGSFVGDADGSDTHAIVRWREDGQVVSKTVSTGAQSLQITAVSQSGLAIGVTDLVAGQSFVWTPQKGLTPLTNLIVAAAQGQQLFLTSASAVNKDGWIVGTYFETPQGNSAPQVFVLEPVH